MRQVMVDAIKPNGERHKRYTEYFHDVCLLSKEEKKAAALANVQAKYGKLHIKGTTYKVVVAG